KGQTWLTRLGVFTLVILMPVLAACGGAAATPPPPQAKEVKIGVVLSLTGDNQIYGNPQKNAIQLAIDEINAAGGVPAGKLTPIFEDDAGAKDKGVTAFEKLINTDKVLAIIGPTLSNTALAAD